MIHFLYFKALEMFTSGLYLLVTGFVEIGAQHSGSSGHYSSAVPIYPSGLSLVLPRQHPCNLALCTRLGSFLNIVKRNGHLSEGATLM